VVIVVEGGMEMTTTYRTTTTRTRFFPHNGCGQEEEEEEEEEEEQHPFQEDHVDVTNWLYLLDRSMTPPLPRESYFKILCFVNLRNKLL
jgi:hypothetical protein